MSRRKGKKRMCDDTSSIELGDNGVSSEEAGLGQGFFQIILKPPEEAMTDHWRRVEGQGKKI